MTVVNLWKALRLGKQIKNPATWKNTQNATNAIAGIICFIGAALPLVGVNVPISETDQLTIAGGLAALLGWINVVLTTATTEKIGLPGLK